ncbi:hypothetical protein I2492_09405 [Budviciaceae bacterium CWB-B4]|uniref:Uncharacterized protein n=1 Tax=Limnobaculum xujianqingii TaxID=2738837 RepID=A0A9D7FXQ5_9GAMM|nr:hypothetical protein [Limnobaculum xujianqingii]MBK5073231.1 hypothetical protein [Limnobaculum xujianqingii]MBK5176540.1 hypothetical protein [Limnobaculum xujianqingii]
MSKFRAQLSRDQSTFYNKAEFARTIKWNGYDLVVQDETPPDLIQFGHGTNAEYIVFRCPASAFSSGLPVNDEVVVIDGSHWTVREIQKPHDDLIIKLDRLVS